MEEFESCFTKLNDPKEEERLAALQGLMELSNTAIVPVPAKTIYVNNHIHTTYSFSPYSPSKALYLAWKNGLCTAGIMDHDSIGGAKEFLKAGEIMQMPVTVGMECRVSMKKTACSGKQLNNPDQISVAYVAMHGIPHDKFGEVDAFMKPYREKRDERNRQMCQRINTLVAPFSLTIDYDTDVLPHSNHDRDGSVTERHILFALTQKILQRYQSANEALLFLKDEMGLPVSRITEEKIFEADASLLPYDILGILKSNLVEKIYVDADGELPQVEDFIAICKKIGAISAYAYLGDISDSVTGDKKAQCFEDAYLDLLFEELKRLGFDAVTYMPTRNTETQLRRVISLCDQYGFFQISGEDINSPRQSFLCKKLTEKQFSHLIENTWALIGHEIAATKDQSEGMFSNKTIKKYPRLKERIRYFADLVHENTAVESK